MNERRYDLEDRLINFSAELIAVVEELPPTKASSHLGGQLLRSGTAPALHYGEAQSAESQKDFIHKMKGALKELRESHINLRILEKVNLLGSADLPTLVECNELIRIFKKSIETAERNLSK
ncbi:four helix bundle protein [Larkinella terrae]|uniref:Four helix bundle protein n=1 Tax=Larkinella terrae TaxID=2025311 RepID=A0A7K0EW80_9BACT|nr:four helix bundle protein [Larkinella terrae]MRS65638.1 four helix bundle protein [Larkinella terrae]